MDPEKRKRSQRLENFAHYLASFVIIMKGIDKIDMHGKTGVGILFILLGLFIILGTIFHHRAEKFLRHFKAYVMVVEVVVISIVGYMYMQDGKQYLPYVCFATAILFLIALVVYMKKGARPH
jgi:hypothetical protein